MLSRNIALFLFFQIFLSGLAFCQGSPLEARTGQLRVQQTSQVNALVELAKNVKVPFAIVCADEELRTTQISVDLDGATVQQALLEITSSRHDLAFSTENGVVVVQKVPLPTDCSYLNTTVPVFDANRDTVQHLSAKLWMTLQSQLDPSKTGFLGVLHPTPADKNVGPAELRGKTVKEILIWLVAKHGGAAWVAFPSPAVTQTSMDNLWEIFFYDRNAK
jgi:hypothetical protein